jgi:hypothetical protein
MTSQTVWNAMLSAQGAAELALHRTYLARAAAGVPFDQLHRDLGIFARWTESEVRAECERTEARRRPGAQS